MKRFIALSLVFLASGCEGKDAEAVQRVGRKALDKAADLAAEAKAKVPLPLPQGAGPAQLDAEPSVGEKVAKRLRWDRELADAAIEAREEKEGIVLVGQVPTENARRRALAIAASTVGVSEVVDRLKVAAPPPGRDQAQTSSGSVANGERRGQ